MITSTTSVSNVVITATNGTYTYKTTMNGTSATIVINRPGTYTINAGSSYILSRNTVSITKYNQIENITMNCLILISNGTTLGDTVTITSGAKDSSTNAITGGPVWYGNGDLSAKTVRLKINNTTKYPVNTEKLKIYITGYVDYLGYQGTDVGVLDSKICTSIRNPSYSSAWYDGTSNLVPSNKSVFNVFHELTLEPYYTLSLKYIEEIGIIANCIERDRYLDLYVQSVYLVQ